MSNNYTAQNFKEKAIWYVKNKACIIIKIVDCYSGEIVKSKQVKELEITFMTPTGGVTYYVYNYKIESDNNVEPDNSKMNINFNKDSQILTNESGEIKINISPFFQAETDIHIKIGFLDFPVIRPGPEDEGDIIWAGGDQKTGYDENFGWKFAGSSNFFSAKISLPIINLAKLKEESCNKKIFVLKAMQWCQPVWDGIEDPPEMNQVNNKAYTYNNRYIIHKKMHIVTKLNSYTPNGKNYGFYNGTRINDSGTTYNHQGLDVYAKVNFNVFAIYGGETENLISEGTAGLYLKLKWKNKVGIQQQISYMHFDSHNLSIHNKHVIAGEIIGKAGRKNFGSVYPTHVHLYYYNNNVKSKLSFLREYVKNNYHNKYSLCIPFEDFPLLFPCACQFGTGQDISDCKFENQSTIIECWAAQEGRCYYDNKKILNVKKQLTQLANSEPEKYIQIPLSGNERINGLWANGSKAAIKKFREQNFSTIYSTDYSIYPSTEEEWTGFPEEGSNTRALLNSLAPL